MLFARIARPCSVALLGLGVLLGACQDQRPTVDVSNPQVASYLQLVMPARIEIQRYLTKPVSFAGSGQADGVEVILAAYDAFEDLTKVAGEFQFELLRLKPGDPIGQRVAFWPIPIDSKDAMRRYRDHLSRFYHFPLQLAEGTFEPGPYKLSVWLHLPTGDRLYDEYEFSYEGTGAPAFHPVP